MIPFITYGFAISLIISSKPDILSKLKFNPSPYTLITNKRIIIRRIILTLRLPNTSTTTKIVIRSLRNLNTSLKIIINIILRFVIIVIKNIIIFKKIYFIFLKIILITILIIQIKYILNIIN